MIVLADFENQALLSVFPEQCLKATPDPEFLSYLYDFDMSWPFRFGPTSGARLSHITHIFKETFDAINSTSRVPELLVWMQRQVCLSIIMCPVHSQWLSLNIYRNTLIRGMTSLGIIRDLLRLGLIHNYLQLKFMAITTPKSLGISLHPQHWWISHNFPAYTISYHRFWI